MSGIDAQRDLAMTPARLATSLNSPSEPAPLSGKSQRRASLPASSPLELVSVASIVSSMSPSAGGSRSLTAVRGLYRRLSVTASVSPNAAGVHKSAAAAAAAFAKSAETAAIGAEPSDETAASLHAVKQLASVSSMLASLDETTPGLSAGWARHIIGDAELGLESVKSRVAAESVNPSNMRSTANFDASNTNYDNDIAVADQTAAGSEYLAPPIALRRQSSMDQLLVKRMFREQHHAPAVGGVTDNVHSQTGQSLRSRRASMGAYIAPLPCLHLVCRCLFMIR